MKGGMTAIASKSSRQLKWDIGGNLKRKGQHYLQ